MRSSSLAYLSQRQARATLFLLLIALFPLASSATVHAQGAAPVQSARTADESSTAAVGASGSITGRVLGEDGRPVAEVQVFIYGAFGGATTRNSLTDSSGRFQFKEVSPGLYTLRLSAPAYIELPDENRTPFEPKYLKPGDAAQLTMVKGGVITGTVLNPQGDPLVNVNVRAMRVRDSQGRRIFPEPGFGGMPRMTDDRGVYRLYGLQPGSYLLVTGGSNPYYIGMPGLFDGDVPTYYPSSTRDTAVEVSVRAGEEATGVDIRYRGERGHTISGEVSGSIDTTARFAVSVILSRATTGIYEAQGYATNMGGKRVFALNGVPDGEYEIATQAYTEKSDVVASAPRRISVRGSDVTGLQLQLSPMASIAGRITLEPLQTEGSCAKTNAQAAMQQTLISARRENQDKERLQPRAFSTGGHAPNEQGEFLIRNLSDGLFRISVRPPGDDWYVRSATFPRLTPVVTDPAKLAGKAAPAAAPVFGTVTTRRGERTSGITIYLSQGATSLSGRVVAQAEGASVPANLRAYLVPTERERADDPLRYAETNVSADGSFAFTSLAPGRYWITLRPFAPPTDLLQWPRLLAWDEGARNALRREAEAANNALELKPCQQVKDYSLGYAPK